MKTTEDFWKGRFGDEYHKRQGDVGSVDANAAMFANILNVTDGIEQIIEFGAGTGRNLEAISELYPEIELTGVELHRGASDFIPADYVYRMNMMDYNPEKYGKADLVFTKGLLIHINPEDLPQAYHVLYTSSRRYILVAEYYNPTPVSIEYHGHEDKLWKRDFAGDLLTMYPDLSLVDYGFVYHKDQFPQDDVTWFLLEKQS